MYGAHVNNFQWIKNETASKRNDINADGVVSVCVLVVLDGKCKKGMNENSHLFIICAPDRFCVFRCTHLYSLRLTATQSHGGGGDSSTGITVVIMFYLLVLEYWMLLEWNIGYAISSKLTIMYNNNNRSSSSNSEKKNHKRGEKFCRTIWPITDKYFMVYQFEFAVAKAVCVHNKTFEL